jgi:hypothetical protein
LFSRLRREIALGFNPACGGREFLLRRENFAFGERISAEAERISRLRREIYRVIQPHSSLPRVREKRIMQV